MRPPSAARAAFRRLSPRSRGAILHRLGIFAPWEDGFDFTPPAPVPGQSPGPPDFVGIGVQKAGTSWWYELIADHPAVWARGDIHKERHFFAPLAAAPFGATEATRYAGWFPRPAGTITGEWTPDYLAYPWVPPMLHRAAPGTRLLLMVRDPVERFRSGLSFRLAMGAPDTEATLADAVRHGFYAAGLARFLEWFPTEQVLVLQYERCAADPAGQLAATYRFLGLCDHVPADLRRSVNVSGAKVDLDDDARARLVELYSADVAELARLVPAIDTDLWPNFGRRGI